MASNAGAIATETPLSSLPAPAPPSALPSEETARILKRQRESSPSSPRSLSGQQTSPLQSPTKSARLALAARFSPPPLTGAAALEDERRRREAGLATTPETSENPSHQALASLMSGGAQVMSRPADAPAPTAAMDAVPRAPYALSIPSNPARSEDHETSPQSVTSMSGVAVTASPTPMDVDNRPEHDLAHQVGGQDDRTPPVSSMSYPGPLHANNATDTPARGMSFPMGSQEQTSPTTGGKKHKCPYCSQEFTRHHNLKSHLLTHSQEKPYVCTDCQMRFRRLHDLKRHGKLHSGEKPHICPKCNRSFARGDALARHARGQGGCAGRRSSMGSFADGEEMDGLPDADETAMSGMSYDHGEEELRRQSLPSINAQHVSAPGSGDSYTSATHSRTYPPAGPRPTTTGLYPPTAGQTQSSTGTSTSGHTASSTMSATAQAPAASMYSQAGMTESPKPLSPGLQTHEAAAARQRSPSLNQQMQQQQYTRRQSELQSPHGGQARPKLPGLSHPGFTAPTAPAPAAPAAAGGYSHSRNSSGPQPPSESGNMFAQSDPSVWAYIQALEEKIKSLSDRVVSLDHEVATLKKTGDGAPPAAA